MSTIDLSVCTAQHKLEITMPQNIATSKTNFLLEKQKPAMSAINCMHSVLIVMSEKVYDL